MIRVRREEAEKWGKVWLGLVKRWRENFLHSRFELFESKGRTTGGDEVDSVLYELVDLIQFVLLAVLDPLCLRASPHLDIFFVVVVVVAHASQHQCTYSPGSGHVEFFTLAKTSPCSKGLNRIGVRWRE